MLTIDDTVADLFNVDIENLNQRIMVFVKCRGIQVVSFEFPNMDPEYFIDFRCGKEVQNDDGFFMKLKDGFVTFQIEPNTDGGDYKPVEIRLPYKVCGEQFFIDLQRSCEKNREEEEKEHDCKPEIVAARASGSIEGTKVPSASLDETKVLHKWTRVVIPRDSGFLEEDYDSDVEEDGELCESCGCICTDLTRPCYMTRIGTKETKIVCDDCVHDLDEDEWAWIEG